MCFLPRECCLRPKGDECFRQIPQYSQQKFGIIIILIFYNQILRIEYVPLPTHPEPVDPDKQLSVRLLLGPQPPRTGPHQGRQGARNAPPR
ncbi:hypothetical protein FGO68_gene15478 [Halteria grandinella]|uniref:Uncharacterized protein n=1 Tax=Halteria grandinella TaxID=5974 RepID=A0A8J8SU96_HALGN|nr:hypothetical protein FGO68_gene15478 [Halteria grandinella]